MPSGAASWPRRHTGAQDSTIGAVDGRPSAPQGRPLLFVTEGHAGAHPDVSVPADADLRSRLPIVRVGRLGPTWAWRFGWYTRDEVARCQCGMVRGAMFRPQQV